MAGPTTFKLRHAPRESVERQQAVEFNRALDDLERVRAAVVALAATTKQSESVASIATAATLTAGKLATPGGVVIAE